jgi:multidrug resistance efflux pump
MKNFTIELSWKAFLKPHTIILLLVLGCFFYWFFTVRPYLGVDEARLSAPFLEVRTDQGGRLTYAPFEEGDSIKQGQILFSLSTVEEKLQQKQMQATVDSFQNMLAYYSAGIEKATEEYIAARKSIDFDLGSADSSEPPLAVLQQQQRQAKECKEQLSAAQENLERANQLVCQKAIAAPFSGVIVKRLKREGDLLSFGDMVYSLCDPSQVWVDAIIPEKHITKISIGQKASVRLLVDKQRHWEGTIVWISPMALLSNEGVPVRISLKKKNGDLLIPNLKANVKIKIN